MKWPWSRTANGKGRIFKLDHRDARFLLRTVTPTTRPARKTWRLAERLDQGARPWCVAYAWNHLLRATPRQQRPLEPGVVYHAAQRLDDIPGENYDGTTVRGAAEYLATEANLIKEYRWAFSAEDALNAVGNRGPVVLGTNWMTGMDNPSPEGIIHFTGRERGGHAYLLLGYNDHRSLALIHNSWGEAYGIRGRAWLPYADLEAAIREAGEACTATE